MAALIARAHDLVVIGGGIQGAAVAWDAAQRGLSVALLEAADFGASTSWNSLKTIHGGLRHLQRADLGGLRESARERTALLRIAPELVRPLRFLMPTYRGRGRGRAALALAMRAADLLTVDRNRGLPPGQRLPPGRLLSAREVLELVPALDAQGLTGGAEWTDAQIASGERLLIAFLRAAAEQGALAANYVEVNGLQREGARVSAVTARDRESGARLTVRARMVVNAAGPAVDRVLAAAGLARAPVPLLRALNLVLDRALVATHAVGGRSGGRYLFLVPWRGRSIVGTAYEPPESPPDGAPAFLEEVRRAYPWAGLQAADVALVHRGLVPGRDGARGLWTRSRLIDHEAEDGLVGLVSIVSVKYTTARAMAERAVDLALVRLGRKLPPCRTAWTPLAHAREPEGTLEERARRAAREEMALHLDDAVLRRLDLGTAGRPPESEVEAVTAVMTAEHGWDAAHARSERARLEEALRAAGAR